MEDENDSGDSHWWPNRAWTEKRKPNQACLECRDRLNLEFHGDVCKKSPHLNEMQQNGRDEGKPHATSNSVCKNDEAERARAARTYSVTDRRADESGGTSSSYNRHYSLSGRGVTALAVRPVGAAPLSGDTRELPTKGPSWGGAWRQRLFAAL